MSDFNNQIVLIKKTEKKIEIIAHQDITFDETSSNQIIEYLTLQFDIFYNEWLQDNQKTIKLFFDTSNINSFQAYKFAKKLYPFFKDKEDITKKFITDTYVLCNSSIIRFIINKVLSQQKLERPVYLVKSFDDIF